MNFSLMRFKGRKKQKAKSFYLRNSSSGILRHRQKRARSDKARFFCEKHCQTSEKHCKIKTAWRKRLRKLRIARKESKQLGL
ncbi:hypothetical protein D0872_10345 [Bacillus velezensis]|nr:hypothetical protein D0872_10345 [Bacillus velezensis]